MLQEILLKAFQRTLYQATTVLSPKPLPFLVKPHAAYTVYGLFIKQSLNSVVTNVQPQ